MEVALEHSHVKLSLPNSSAPNQVSVAVLSASSRLRPAPFCLSTTALLLAVAAAIQTLRLQKAVSAKRREHGFLAASISTGGKVCMQWGEKIQTNKKTLL